MNAKIAFFLEQNEDGYPPISVELLNATVVSDGVFRIENAPYFASDVSYHDVVEAKPIGNPEQIYLTESLSCPHPR